MGKQYTAWVFFWSPQRSLVALVAARPRGKDQSIWSTGYQLSRRNPHKLLLRAMGVSGVGIKNITTLKLFPQPPLYMSRFRNTGMREREAAW